MNIYLIRHGKSLDDENGIAQSDSTPLAPSAIKSLEKTKSFLSTKTFSKIFASPFVRAQQTATVLFPNQNVITLDYIYEYLPPKNLIGKPFVDVITFWEKDYAKEKYESDWKIDGGESFSDITGRAKKFLAEVNDISGDIAVVGHGTFFRHIIGIALSQEKYTPQIFIDFTRKININNGAIIHLESTKSGGLTVSNLFNFT